MQKVFSIKNLVFLLSIFLLAILLVTSNTLISTSSNAEERASSGTLGNSVNVELVNRENQTIELSSQIEYSGGLGYVSQWSESKEFRINYVVDEDNLPTGIPDSSDPEIMTYTMTISIEFLQGYSDSEGGFDIDAKVLFEDVILEGDERSITTDNYNDLQDFTYVFNIDSGLTETTGNVTKTASGWGIYRFTIDINGFNSTSDFFIVEPSEALSQPQIQATAIPSDNSMHDSYLFTLVNAEEYKYIDQSCLVWYIDGEGIDGTKYCLLNDEYDTALGIYDETYTPLWPERYNRTGTEFTFNDNEKAGTYQVWCRYQYHNSTTATSSDRRITVTTGNPTDYTYIIYIVVGIALLSVIVTIIIAVMKKRREKVW